MHFTINDHIPADFPPDTRVWIYQSNRLFTLQEAFELENRLQQFAESWTSHGVPVRGYANLFFGRFILIMADETGHNVSGCSIDSSVRLIKNIEQQFGVDLFNRQLLAFWINEKVEVIPMQQLSYALANGLISAETLFFNNTVLTKSDLQERWIIPVKESWVFKRMG